AAPVTAATLPANRPRSLIEQPAAREHVAAEHLGGIDGVRLGLAAQATEDRIAARLLGTPLGGEAAGADPVQRGPQAVPRILGQHRRAARERAVLARLGMQAHLAGEPDARPPAGELGPLTPPPPR